MKTTWKYSTGSSSALTILQPLRARQRLALRAVPVAAAVERDALVAAGITLLDMPAQRRGAAALDGAHHAQLRAAEGAGVVATVLRADLAEDLRQLQPGGAHGRRVRSGRRLLVGDGFDPGSRSGS